MYHSLYGIFKLHTSTTKYIKRLNSKMALIVWYGGNKRERLIFVNSKRNITYGNESRDTGLEVLLKNNESVNVLYLIYA